jgi:hypothetical protein
MIELFLVDDVGKPAYPAADRQLQVRYHVLVEKRHYLTCEQREKTLLTACIRNLRNLSLGASKPATYGRFKTSTVTVVHKTLFS